MSQFLHVSVWFKLNKLHFGYRAKMYIRNCECVIIQVSKGALISS